jgi:hypothetical protein
MKRAIKPVVHKFTLGKEPDSVFYWKRKSLKARLESLEILRAQFIKMKYGTRPRFQRVYRIIERASS